MRNAAVCIFVFLLACHGRNAAAPAPDPATAGKVDVVSKIISCTTLEQCEQDCAQGRGDGCAFAGRLYEYGHGVAIDTARAFGLYDRSCGLGSAAGCYNAALLLEAGRGVNKDAGRAAALFNKVCQMGSATACARAEAIAH